MVERITRDELKAKLDRGDAVTLVEALPRRYFEDGHLPAAVNLPHDQVEALAARLLPDRAAEIVVYCANTPCPNSAVAAGRLVRLGYARVREYVEGKQDWVEAGYALEKGAARAAA